MFHYYVIKHYGHSNYLYNSFCSLPSVVKFVYTHQRSIDEDNNLSYQIFIVKTSSPLPPSIRRSSDGFRVIDAVHVPACERLLSLDIPWYKYLDLQVVCTTLEMDPEAELFPEPTNQAIACQTQ
eukprot:764634-Hanusia_phi.AAC.2